MSEKPKLTVTWKREDEGQTAVIRINVNYKKISIIEILEGLKLAHDTLSERFEKELEAKGYGGNG